MNAIEEKVGVGYDPIKYLDALNEPDEPESVCFYDSATAWLMGFDVVPSVMPRLSDDINPHLKVPEDV